MKYLILRGSLLLSLFAVSTVGCDLNHGGMTVGGVVEFDPNEGADDDLNANDAEPDHDAEQPQRRDNGRNDWNNDRDKPQKSDWGWGNNRRMPSDSMPSKKSHWGRDRRMPSDSMPSKKSNWGRDRRMPGDSMPSKKSNWGRNRRMPSDSMPSKKSNWGSKRSMPSDNMPSKSFGRRSVFDD